MDQWRPDILQVIEVEQIHTVTSGNIDKEILAKNLIQVSPSQEEFPHTLILQAHMITSALSIHS